MERALLNDHDANQGAQSQGEFLGMTGNSGWYLLGSVAASLTIVILCWGVFGISLLLCLFVGVVLCLLSVVYVFTLKNNRPDHYDTDFFEAALIEAGVIERAFGPRQRRIGNPFRADVPNESLEIPAKPARRVESAPRRSVGANREPVRRGTATRAPAVEHPTKARQVYNPVVPLAAFEHVREELDVAEEALEEALTERAEG